MRRAVALLILLPIGLGACTDGPNVTSAKDYTAPAAPPVRNPLYDPYAAYGETNATWTPPVFNRDGTIMKPSEPASQSDRPGYEFAPWASGASGGSQTAPPGTF
jgi:hypothetical protein